MTHTSIINKKKYLVVFSDGRGRNVVVDSSGIRTYPYQTWLPVSLISGTDYLWTMQIDSRLWRPQTSSRNQLV